MTSRSIVRNLRSGNSSAPTDMALNTFDNGVATLDIAGDLQKLATYGDSEERVEKRFDGAGFKIVFSTRMHSKLTVSHQKQMSLAIAKEWARRGDSTSMNEFFGLVKTGHKANFYHRIIPEVRGFGMNYESVDACGQMASFL